MPNEGPLLTIAIPTHNRARYLDQLLAILLKQTSGESQVELLGSDNASPDETQALVKSQQYREAAIRYIRNETNVGADRNILQFYEQAAGRYVWIFSDVDLIEPGTVKRVINALSCQKYDVLCIRGYNSGRRCSGSCGQTLFSQTNLDCDWSDSRRNLRRCSRGIPQCRLRDSEKGSREGSKTARISQRSPTPVNCPLLGAGNTWSMSPLVSSGHVTLHNLLLEFFRCPEDCRRSTKRVNGLCDPH
jgi:glycosyltransferase involved in cell wall biosynthesis